MSRISLICGPVAEKKQVPRHVPELIKRRRYQVLVHSCLYYLLDYEMIEDSTWDAWAEELYQLQLQYPEVCSLIMYSKQFEGFEPATGYKLEYKDEQIMTICKRLLNAELRRNPKNKLAEDALLNLTRWQYETIKGVELKLASKEK